MALVKFLCGVTVMLVLSPNGSHSQQLGCGRGMGDPKSDNWPWRAIIASPSSLTNCSGSLITDQWVLTSNDCNIRSEEGTWVHLGQSRNSFATQLYEQSVTVEDITCSDDDDDEGLLINKPGVCLVKLSSPVNITDSISTVCLVAQNSNSFSGMKSYVASGTTSAARMEVPIVGRNECKCNRPEIGPSVICAGRGVKEGTFTDCMTNVGGALMAYQNNSWTQIGINQYDQRCPPAGHVRTYTDVSLYEQWIRDVTGMSTPGFIPLGPKEYDPDTQFRCKTMKPRPTQTPMCPYPTRFGCMDDSLFASGVNMMPSFPFVLLSVLFLSLYGT
ncbi:chymotrypsin-like protease CTRL-1 [Labrus mixtus]|uniref:chymotrypsin-like protease CTRL-1 n=1 Tax=Labrus mixtus TaxID=508554 RepID=UPI0029BFC9D0|nr:chymotrypsin-like protease CTRL-1 [Labrus mixtus]